MLGAALIVIALVALGGLGFSAHRIGTGAVAAITQVVGLVIVYGLTRFGISVSDATSLYEAAAPAASKEKRVPTREG
jgi:hypothetical protein